MSLAQIAKMTGVSTATVSRALNNSPLVREETASRIRDAVAKIGYVPPPPRARSSSRRERQQQELLRHRVIAVITIGQMHRGWMVLSPVIATFVSCVTMAAREFDVDVMLDGIIEPEDVARITRREDLGGAILLIDSPAIENPELIRAVDQLGKKLPVVWAMGGHGYDFGIDHVLTDNLTVGRMAADHLADLGCRRVAVVTSTPQWPLTRQRVLMFTISAIDRGLDVTTHLVTDRTRDRKVFAGDVVVHRSLDNAADVLGGSKPRVEGLFCPRDYETARMYPALLRAGFKPQQDLAVVSCDNDQSQLELMSPPPSTIDINPHEVARIAIRRLRSRMRHPGEPSAIINVQPKLHVSDVTSTFHELNEQDAPTEAHRYNPPKAI